MINGWPVVRDGTLTKSADIFRIPSFDQKNTKCEAGTFIWERRLFLPNEFQKVLQTAVRVDVNRFYAKLFLLYCSSISRQLNAHQNSVFFIMTISSLVGKKCSLPKKNLYFFI